MLPMHLTVWAAIIGADAIFKQFSLKIVSLYFLLMLYSIEKGEEIQ